MYKYSLALICFFLSIGTILCQVDSQSQANKKFNFCFHLGINETFVEGKNGIIDSYGLTIKDVSPGFTFGAKINYSVDNHITLLSGLTLISYETITYKYYGITYTESVGKPQIPFLFQYHFSNKNNKKSWFLSIGTMLSFEINSSKSFLYYPSDILRPERSIKSTLNSQVNPIIQFGIGKSITNGKGRKIEQILFFNKGLNNVNEFEFSRENPKIPSNFKYRGSTLNYSLRWYFKRK